MRSFRFGVQCSRAGSGAEWIEFVKKAEYLGYDFLSLPDHFDDRWAPMPALAAAAAVTSRIRLGALVFANDYRHPVVLAKELATLDVISGGRAVISLGAGWTLTDYKEAGLEYDPIGVRIDRMLEGIRVIKGLMGDQPFTFEGRHYRVTGLNGTPKPLQRPHPPVLIGGGGKRILSIAAREADVVGINFNLAGGDWTSGIGASGTREATLEKARWVKEAAGDRWDQIEIHASAHVVTFLDDPSPVLAGYAAAVGMSPEQAAESPHYLEGPVERMVETLERRRRDFGISFVSVPMSTAEAFAPVVARLAGR